MPLIPSLPPTTQSCAPALVKRAGARETLRGIPLLDISQRLCIAFPARGIREDRFFELSRNRPPAKRVERDDFGNRCRGNKLRRVRELIVGRYNVGSNVTLKDSFREEDAIITGEGEGG